MDVDLTHRSDASIDSDTSAAFEIIGLFAVRQEEEVCRGDVVEGPRHGGGFFRRPALRQG